jgi:hypothetical protein
MRRLQLIEFHEQPWFPSLLRDEITDALQFGLNRLKLYILTAPLLQNMLNGTGSISIVDLCSGAGGPWFELSRKLSTDSAILQVWLTDKYLNARASLDGKALSENQVAFYPSPVSATDVPSQLNGLRTMFSSFHHFPPEQARAILQNAVNARVGIGIFEITKRAPSTIMLMFPWALMSFLFTPWIRPFRWARLFWTYVFPIVPLVLLFDGVMSCLRTYSAQELSGMVKTLNGPEYRWEIGEHPGKVRSMPITYLIGCPHGAERDSINVFGSFRENEAGRSDHI